MGRGVDYWFEIDIDHIGASEDIDMDIVDNGDDIDEDEVVQLGWDPHWPVALSASNDSSFATLNTLNTNYVQYSMQSDIILLKIVHISEIVCTLYKM